MATPEEFAAAAVKVRAIAALPPDQLLRLYALFKQAGAGDAAGERPGMLDFKGRAKHDAWSALQGMSQSDARAAYVTLVETLLASHR